MRILHTLPRHEKQLRILRDFCTISPDLIGTKYIIVAIDGPESVNRQASFASSFEGEDTHKLFNALAEQTRP